MRHQLLSSPIAMSSSSSKSPNLKKNRSNPNPNPPCHHSASATLDLLILLLVLFAGTFLVSSYFSYTLHSLSLVLPSLDYVSLCFSAFLVFLFFASAYCTFRLCYFSRKCGNAGCKGLRRAMEFDLRLQSEECLRLGGKAVVEVDELPWKGGGEGNRDYECLRNELRRMAPVNGRAVLVFQKKCGCPFAKLEGWCVKRGRKNKK
ncbi:hypothetical protein ACET3Z_002155 [Daucus carota]